jgi:hypothetical protein|nr:MAG TPA: hypothetical protein [Caudoviricetes sp.]
MTETAQARNLSTMKPLFDGDSLAKVVTIPITAEEVREVPISDETQKKLEDLKKELEELRKGMTGEDEAADRVILKQMIDKGLTTLFDKETADLIYELCGKEVITYTEKYALIAEFINSHFQDRVNSEVFAKYALKAKK